MTIDDRRIAWPLTAEAFECGSAVTRACLSVAAEAGFRVVAMNHSMASVTPGVERFMMLLLLMNEADCLDHEHRRTRGTRNRHNRAERLPR